VKTKIKKGGLAHYVGSFACAEATAGIFGKEPALGHKQNEYGHWHAQISVYSTLSARLSDLSFSLNGVIFIFIFIFIFIRRRLFFKIGVRKFGENRGCFGARACFQAFIYASYMIN